MRVIFGRALLGMVVAAGVAPALAQVNVDAPGAKVEVGPDNGPGAVDVDAGGGNGVRVNAPGVRVRVGGAEGNTIQVGPDGVPVMPRPDTTLVAPDAAPAPRYWLGVVGGEVSPELRAQLNLEGTGVIVREVVADSPAEKAGVKAFDIIVGSANGDGGEAAIGSMDDLSRLVAEVGVEGGQFDLQVIRGGKQMSLAVTPEARPNQPERPLTREPGVAIDGPNNFHFRLFGPGAMVQQQRVEQYVVDGTSVKIETQNGQTSVQVERDGDSWDLDPNVPEALAQLPADVRVTVDGILAKRDANQGPVNVDVDVDGLLNRLPQIFQNRGARRGMMSDPDMQQEFERMRAELREMRKQLGMPAENEAPAFDPNAPAPPAAVAPKIDIEIPADAE
ncbi:serine endoprotease [Pirellulimonas nuda]|uniref:Serine endoprotease n=1 Tax=Pirellulimonas nuda TaxID=2528009 RepID=A0A518D5V7_9BACT|nr:PDZ domain-containing protein [Pirellulimonas nuda]QDU86857.1 serine endoprotease [Pirellulimonas nuda]